jgi:hypothetical protein
LLEFLVCLLAFIAVVALFAHCFAVAGQHQALNITKAAENAASSMLAGYCNVAYFNSRNVWLGLGNASAAAVGDCFSPATLRQAGALRVSGVKRWFPDDFQP